MNKISLKSGIALFVLSAGLISCSKEEKVRDVYQASSPIIITAQGQQALKAWDLGKEKSWDLQDAIDVTASQPVRLDITAHCRRGEENFVESFSFAPVRPVKIFQILPRPLLARSFEKSECSFEVSLFNAAGSRHIFPVSIAPVSEKAPAEVILEIPGEDQARKRLNAAELAAVKVRYRNQQAASAELTCEDFSAPALPFEQVLDFSHFDLSKTQKKPVQTCRVLISQSGAVQQISRLIEIQMPRVQLEVQVQPLPLPGHQSSRAHWALAAAAAADLQKQNAIRLAMTQIQVSNPSEFSRTIRIPKKSLLVNLEIEIAFMKAGVREPNPANDVAPLSGSWLTPAIAGIEGGNLTEDAQYWTAILEAGGTIQVQLNFVPAPVNCPSRIIHGFTVTTGEDFVFAELSPSEEAFEQTQVPLSTQAYLIHHPPYLFNAMKRVNGGCAY